MKNKADYVPLYFSQNHNSFFHSLKHAQDLFLLSKIICLLKFTTVKDIPRNEYSNMKFIFFNKLYKQHINHVYYTNNS